MEFTSLEKRNRIKYTLEQINTAINQLKEWNEDVLSFAQTKSFLGFCALIIILHHCSQRTCAPWLPEFRIVHGLDDFVFW